MRYRDEGNVHKDFHLATSATIQYVLATYGEEFLRELFRRTAHRVYREIYEELRKGNAGPLREHWEYYYTREGGEFRVSETDTGFVFDVTVCPAVRHLRERGLTVTRDFYLQHILLNEAWSEGTPFRIETELLSEGAYRFCVTRSSRTGTSHVS